MTRLQATITNYGFMFASCAMIFNIGMDILAKYAAEEASPWQIVFFRFLFGVAILAVPFLLQSSKTDRSGFRTIHFIRASMNLVGSFCLYHAISTLPLAIVLTIFFLEPILAIFAAAILLKEPVSRTQYLAGIGGFIGVMIIAMPNAHTLSSQLQVNPLDVCVALIGVTSWGIMKVLTKKHYGNISVISLSFWLAAMTSIASFPLAFLNWQPLGLFTLGALAGTALSGAVYNYMWLSALMIIPVSRLANLSYVALPLSFVAGFILFGEVPTPNVYAGSLLIFVCILSANRKETSRA